jgi:general secretion pathway protein L
VVRAEPAVAALAERTLGQQGQGISLYTASERALDAARGDWDLAQFDLASTGRTRALRKAGSALSASLYAPQWRAARWGAALLVVAHLVGLNAWAWQERQALAAKQAAVRNALTQTFPQVKVVVDAPVQMERELALLRQAAGSVSARDLEPLLAAAGAALPDGLQPTGIEYTAGELRLRGVALAPDQESALSARLQAAGYRARLDDGSLLLQATEGAP